MLPHLDAAYNLARWLMRDAAAAEDVVQEAMLRALTYFASFQGVNPRAWLLADRAQRRLYVAKPRSRRRVRADRADGGAGVVASDELVSSADDPEAGPDQGARRAAGLRD